MMNTDKRIGMLQEAQDLINQAIDLIRDAIVGSSVENTANAYLIPDLETAASEDTQWVGKNYGNIDRLIRSLRESEKETEDNESQPVAAIPDSDKDALDIHPQVAELVSEFKLDQTVHTLMGQGKLLLAVKYMRDATAAAYRLAAYSTAAQKIHPLPLASEHS